jgi:hypothetical protein
MGIANDPFPDGRNAATRLWWHAALPFAVLSYWSVCKLLLYWQLEYTSDFFSFLQMTLSWRYTGVLLWENAYGRHYAVHNYYSVLLFSPLTALMGGEGLILGLVGFTAFACWLIANMRQLTSSHKLAIYVVLLGPVGYWLFDHPGYGFHPELLYAPLAVTMAIALVTGRRLLLFATCAVTTLTKENGALVCAGVFVAWHLAGVAAGTITDRARREAVMSAIRAAAFWLAVFAAGVALLWIASQSAPAGQVRSSTRIHDAVRVILALPLGVYPSHRSNFLISLLACTALIVAGACVAGRRTGAVLLIFLVSVPPLAAVELISSAVYGFSLEHGLTWPPRFTLFWGLLLACLILIFAQFVQIQAPLQKPHNLWRRWAWLCLAVVAQIVVTSFVRSYPFSRASLVSLLMRSSPADSLTAAEAEAARCVAQKLPDGESVLVPGSMFAWFDDQMLVWPGLVQSAWQRPTVTLCTSGIGLPADLPCTDDPGAPDSYVVAKSNRLTFYAHPRYEPVLRRCVPQSQLLHEQAAPSAPRRLQLTAGGIFEPAVDIKIISQYPFPVSQTTNAAGEPALFAHPYSRFEVPVPANCRTIRIHYGMAETAWTKSDTSDGVVFTISDSGGRIWSRHLNPRTRPSERNMQSDLVPLPRTGIQSVVLETTNAQDPHWDHAYWSKIEYLTR